MLLPDDLGQRLSAVLFANIPIGDPTQFGIGPARRGVGDLLEANVGGIRENHGERQAAVGSRLLCV